VRALAVVILATLRVAAANDTPERVKISTV
jgi:hypothetical protein